MAKNDLQGVLDLLILKTLSQLDSMHGYGIVLHIRRVSDELIIVEEGSLYPALHRLEHQGWIVAEWGVSELGRRARFYKLTLAGKRQLQQETETWGRFAGAIGRVLDMA